MVMLDSWMEEEDNLLVKLFTIDMQQKTIPEEVRKYLDGLLDEAGVSGVDEATRETLVQELFIQLDDAIIDKVVDYLPVEKLDAFTAFMQGNPSRDQLEKYLQENVPNTQDVFTVAFADFRDAYLQAIKEAKEQTPHI